MELDFDFSWCFVTRGSVFVDMSLSERVPVSGAGEDPLTDPMKFHQVSLLPALPDIQVPKARLGFNQ